MDFIKRISFFIIFLVTLCSTTKNDDVTWQLVNDIHFGHFRDQQQKLWYNSDWLVDDEPENLCTGMNIYQYSCHRKENVHVSKHGHLELIATVNRHRRYDRFLFNSAKITSNKSWMYGRFEMRAILPEGPLLRSVFVLQPALPYRYPGDWLDNGQINGLIYVQQATAIIAGIHYKMPGGQSYIGRKLTTQKNVTTSFNRYSIEWTNVSIRWFFNDFLFFEHHVTKPFDQNFSLVLQLGVGGPEFDTGHGVVDREQAYHWSNNRFIIDYIKVYQLGKSIAQPEKNQPSGSIGHSDLLSNSLIYLLPIIIIIVSI